MIVVYDSHCHVKEIISLEDKQMTEKLIENIINERLTGKAQKNALDLVVFMQENGFSFEGFNTGATHDGEVRWTPTYKGEGIGCVAVAEELMLAAGVDIAIWLGLDCDFEDNGTVDDELKEFAWAHVVNCPQTPCQPPYCENSKNKWKIFGKECESTCHSPLAFFEIDATSLENIKKLVSLIK